VPQQIAEKSIHRSKWSQLNGHQAVDSIGGSKNAGGGSVGYGAKTVVNGSELLIFDRPGRRDRGTKRPLTPADVLIAPG
jgi:hypothetical protein